MATKICSALFILLLVAVCSTAYSAEEKIKVLNPTPPSRMVDRIPLTPRLDTLEGKTIFMVDIGWGGENAAPSIYAEMKDWLVKNIPGVKIEMRKTKGFFLDEQPELLKEIGEKGDAALFGIAG
ncbi:MAG: hypothetical protein GX654_19960 [Desulfatiglans sp.]|nr:hypothetical protein [Desulfatiglans sp.]